MSYGWLGAFRKGAWVSLRSFVLNERKDVGKRISVINSELNKIGHVTVLYKKSESNTSGLFSVTEEREGITISENTVLEKLVQSYIVAGGNPFDVSQFFMPDRAVYRDGDVYQEYPYGGVMYPMSYEYSESAKTYNKSSAGFYPIRKYKALRTGGRRDVDLESQVYINFISAFRLPVQQEIRYKIHDMESRIIKICDLKEQLITERDEIIVQAFGGLVSSMPNFDVKRFAIALRVPKIADYMDSVFFNRDSDGHIDLNDTNVEELAKHSNLWDDILPEESNTAI